MDGNEFFTEFKGALTEPYVRQQLKTRDDLAVYYYTNDRSSRDVDFVLDHGKGVMPLEVKAEVNFKAKRLCVYRNKFQPLLAVRASLAEYKKEEGLLNLPLFAVESMSY